VFIRVLISLLFCLNIGFLFNVFMDFEGRLTNIKDSDIIYKENIVKNNQEWYCVCVNKDYLFKNQNKKICTCFDNYERRNKYYNNMNKTLHNYFDSLDKFENRK